jgi:hypothetical protein
MDNVIYVAWLVVLIAIVGYAIKRRINKRREGERDGYRAVARTYDSQPIEPKSVRPRPLRGNL